MLPKPGRLLAAWTSGSENDPAVVLNGVVIEMSRLPGSSAPPPGIHSRAEQERRTERRTSCSQGSDTRSCRSRTCSRQEPHGLHARREPAALLPAK